MKIRKSILLLLACICLLFTITPAFAMNSHFSTEIITEEDKSRFIENIELTRTDNWDELKSFACFAVNSYGEFAVAGKNQGNAIISVYKENGTYCYKAFFSAMDDAIVYIWG